jgi:hypothetical protein
MTSVLERIHVDRVTFSVEFMPPRDDADEQILPSGSWKASTRPSCR